MARHATVTDRRRSRGMSTIEVIAAAGIMLLTLAIGSSFFVSQQRMLLVQSAYAASQNVTRTFTDLFGREMRMAVYDPSGAAITTGPGGGTCPTIKQGITEATPTSVRFIQDLNGDGDTSDTNENVRYYLSGSSVMRQDGAGTAISLVDGISSGGLTFSYFDNANPPTQLTPAGTPPVLSAAQRDCVAKVRVRLTAQLSNPQFYNIQPLVSATDMEVAIRSRSLVNSAY
jgi:hypothetical protein